MNKPVKIISYTLLSLGIIAIIALISINIVVKNKVENFIKDDLPDHIERSYDKISVNTLDGTILLKNPQITVKNIEDGAKHTFVSAETLVVSGISYWELLFNEKIHIRNITLNEPSFKYYKDRVKSTKDTLQKKTKMEKSILVDAFHVNNSNIALYEKGNDSTKIYTENLSFEIEDIHINQEIFQRKIPFEYKEFRATGDSLFVKANSYDNLSVGPYSIKNGNLIFEDLKYYTKFSKTELSHLLKVQRDHYDVSINSLSIEDFNFGFRDSLFFSEIKMITLNDPQAEIYRDKLVADDLSIKPLYSKSLRELDFDLTIDSVKIKNGALKYEEKVQEENSGGAIQFHDLNADISKLSNTYQEPEKTDIKIKAVFMDNTPIDIDWNFDVQNVQDQFLFKATVGPLDAEKMNRFTQPNLKVRLQGHVSRTYFTIDGNHDSSTTDLKINYSDFKVEVLQKDGKKKNKFLSAVVNIFVSKNSDKKDEHFKEGTGEATRNKTKSVFNQLWISIQSALKKIMI
ncbi:hypothetical protein EI546_08705 [Aequorivita sp. H23M31]|uniref:DUF748 domain-containing protein n=1 Tax=Aequorivita ciconiae TaxID=2494375 RepID=A0A410G3G4_9FLAO|nr:hypothetical protein [Aequorivita sp. H23M31]QAA81793.1 hypothetical protein EI546_08705 [Aequorivita sp. H23M31]